MTIFRSAYDTFVCRDFVMSKVQHALDAVLHTGHLQPIPGSSSAKQLEGGTALANEVPAFIHPYIMAGHDSGHVNPDSLPFAVADVRAFGKFDPHKQAYSVGISNRSAYDFQVLRTRLSNCWVREAPTLLQNVSPLGMRFYSAWIAQQVTRKLTLDMRESAHLQIHAAFFYWSLFHDEQALHSTDKNKAIAQIIKATSINAAMVVEVVNHFEKPIAGVEEFCRLAQEVVGSIRLAQMTPGVLYSLLAGTWFGSNRNEMTAVALEHPPTWLAMVVTASQDRSFHNTEINRLVERLDRKDRGQILRKAVGTTLEAAEA